MLRGARKSAVAVFLILAAGVTVNAQNPLEIPNEVQAQFKQLPQKIDFNFHIKPILSDRCFACHGPDENKRMVNLRLDKPESAYGPLLLGDGAAIVPGKPQESVMLRRVLAQDPERRMPPHETNLTLDAREKALLVKWIKQGAEYKPHWSLISLNRATNRPDFPSNEQTGIDAFIKQKLEQKDLDFNKPAQRALLLRRVSFDLTGLPPTLEELDAFLQDDSPKAYEKAVDRLLASPHYGERMAVDWMDLSRFADTYGYQADNYRPMWRWRDWVIQAFNQNMPYDQFLTWQLAGDLLPNPSKKQILATAFNRNHPQNAEGGIINEEYLVEYAADRTDTFGKAFMGMTVECARCHDHKFDPISQKDYYQLFAFFNNVDEAGQITWSKHDSPSPTALFPTKNEKSQLNNLKTKIRQTQQALRQSKEQQRQAFYTWWDDLRSQSSKDAVKPQGLIARFSLDAFDNPMIPSDIGSATGQFLDPVKMKVIDGRPKFVTGKKGKGIQVDGDMMLDFPQVGTFKKADPFSIGAWINVPESLASGVIFHNNRGGIIYSYKGYQLSIEEGRFDLRLAHTFPYNSIHRVTTQPIPREEWLHVLFVYDGSGKAEGVQFYINGKAQVLETKRDNLYKEIVFVKDDIQTNLRAGARWRSKGFTNGLLDEIAVYDCALTPLGAQWAAGEQTWTQWLRYKPKSLSKNQIAQLYEFYVNNYNQPVSSLKEELRRLRDEYNDLQEYVDEVMVMAEMPQPRETHLLRRGEYNNPGQRVRPDTPESIMPFPESFPRNRLGLAQWLTHPENPLTARVAVNRLWQRFFGKGLVKTPADFGSQGALPTHPMLLDWLAQEFIQSGWDLKALQKKIVMSQTYRQSSIAPPEVQQMDPENLWYARGPKRRLTAEMIRDQALAASGLLVRKIGGPSVKPYQPEGLWAFGTNSQYEQDEGEALYRRSLYTFWKRTVHPPTMNLFDAPSRSYCVVRREKTNTPLQALALLNDPQFIEASRALAIRVLKDPQASARQRLTKLHRLLTAKKPSDKELNLLHDLYQEMRTTFKNDANAMKGLLNEGEMKWDGAHDAASVAAYSVTAGAVMNSDAFIVLR